MSLPRAMEEQIRADTADGMRALGRRIAGLLKAGDLVILSGPLGAGKTTLVQGIGDGLGVRGPITSPTFVIARVHPSLAGGPDLVHADAYRLTSPAEVDDLDLDASLERSVTVVEWGGGLAEGLAADRLEITVSLAPPPAGRGRDGGRDGRPGSRGGEIDRRPRIVRVAGIGERWRAAGEIGPRGPGDSAFLACSPRPEAL